MTRLAPVAAAIAVLALLLLGPLGGGGGATAGAIGLLPPCRYDDLLTTPRGYDDWSVTLVDTILRVPKGYVPPDLVPITKAGLSGADKSIRAIAVDDLRAMVAAATKAASPIGVESAYRSYADQQTLFDAWQPGTGDDTTEAPARPGHSEHQLGLAIDFNSAAPDAKPGHPRFVTTPGGKWMAAHAWEFGWVMSYPDGEASSTCYAFEPWHYRYVGRAQAARVHASGMTLREFLWSRSTTTIVPIPMQSGSATLPTSAPSAALLEEAPSASPAASLPPGTPGPSRSPTPTDQPAEEPVDDPLGVGAGQLVVVGALGIIAASLGLVWAGLRRRRPGAP